MGLTYKNCKIKSLQDSFNIKQKENSYIVALAGNPNTGKSTVFNYLTGLKQHTGNWPGKTIATARGEFTYNNINYNLIDLPGTYSLFALSQEEVVARDFICFGDVDAVIVVCDATCLERNLNLLFQVLELTSKVVLCVNLIDEAEKKSIKINKEKMEQLLGIPVVLTSARNKIGMDELQNALEKVVLQEKVDNKNYVVYNDEIESLVESFKDDLENTFPQINSRWLGLRIIDGDESLFSSLSNYIEGDFEDTLEYIKHQLPQNLDKKRIRDEISKLNYDYASSLFENVVSQKNDKEDIYKTENYLFIRSQETVKVYNINDLSFNKQIGTEIKTGFALTKDGMLWAANSNKLVKINPNSLESEEIQLPNNLKIFIDTTYKPSGLCASITENALYFAHAPNFNGTDIYKFDITTQNVNKFFTAPTNYSGYGAGIQVNPQNGDVYLIYTEDGWGAHYLNTYIYVVDGVTGTQKAIIDYTGEYWFPSTITFQ